MSTDSPQGGAPQDGTPLDGTPRPRTRAEARALREAEELRQAEALREAEARREAEASEPEAPEPETGVPETAAPEPREGAGAVEAPEPEASEPEAPEPETPAPEASAPETSGPAPRSRRFGVVLAVVLGILVLVSAGFAAVSLTQGPRLSDAQVNAAEAIDLSGSRVILTANQALAPIDESQVTVEPAAPFTIDASGRSVGVRFTVPLDDDTEYTVRVSGVVGVGGGPAADLETTFRTPPAEIFLLERDAEGDDQIFRTGLAGDKAVPVFSADRIDDFRATQTQLVAAVEKDDSSSIVVLDRDGQEQRELELPGDGYVTGIQVSDRGGYIAYTYSDREISETSGRASVLVTQRLDGSDEPRIVTVGGEEVGIAEWHFVPDSAALLFIDFDGALALQDLGSDDAEVQALGNAMAIPGVSRGTYTAVVERTDGTLVQLNLADGSETPLAASDPDYGDAVRIVPYPGGTLRNIVVRDENGFPLGQAVIRVDDDGAATSLFDVSGEDTVLQTCASPSGRYAAVVIAPDLVNNPYDDLFAPLPQTMHTHLLDVETGEEMVVLSGFDISWCEAAPGY